MAAFPVGDFETLETGLKVYWSVLRYRGKVFGLDTGEEVVKASLNQFETA